MVYHVSLSSDICGTSLKGEVLANYSELETLFGEPLEGDYKISGEWVFEDADGNVFTLYDWKETELYDEDLPSVRKFRASKEPVSFHIGGRISAVDFKNWLEYQLAKLRSGNGKARSS